MKLPSLCSRLRPLNSLSVAAAANDAVAKEAIHVCGPKCPDPQTSVVKEAIRSGTIASIVMIPFGFVFKTLGLRVGHYGPKLGEFLFGLQPAPWMQMLLLAQHLVIGWLSAMPLLLLWRWTFPRSPALADGLLYGTFYYATVNGLALPAVFGDPFPWQLGWSYVYPSLVVHLIFGLSLAVTVRAFHTHPGFIPVNPKGSS